MKYVYVISVNSGILSLLSWERGLKYNIIRGLDNRGQVAPLVGAWIEIRIQAVSDTAAIVSLLSWERGLKSRSKQWRIRRICRSSRGSVD